jgi:hypothetical protein
MENLLSSAASHKTLPDSFVFAPDQRPPASAADVALPVIDLARPRDEVRRAVLEAGKELGFFQVRTSLSALLLRHLCSLARSLGFLLSSRRD